jgi:hypothetical protein
MRAVGVAICVVVAMTAFCRTSTCQDAEATRAQEGGGGANGREGPPAGQDEERVVSGYRLGELRMALLTGKVVLEDGELSSSILDQKLATIVLLGKPGTQDPSKRLIERCLQGESRFIIGEILSADDRTIRKHLDDRTAVSLVAVVRASGDARTSALAGVAEAIGGLEGAGKEVAEEYAGAVLAANGITQGPAASFVSAYRSRVLRNAVEQIDQGTLAMQAGVPVSVGPTEVALSDVLTELAATGQRVVRGDKINYGWVGPSLVLVKERSRVLKNDPTALGIDELNNIVWFSSASRKISLSDLKDLWAANESIKSFSLETSRSE